VEITFRECKQVVGAGQQQVRFIHASVGAFHICLWTYTLTEAWAWDREEDELVDRSTSPWDREWRRPSHADKRRAWRRELLGEEIRAVPRPGATETEIQTTADRLLTHGPWDTRRCLLNGRGVQIQVKAGHYGDDRDGW
jgi:hypothetical protein